MSLYIVDLKDVDKTKRQLVGGKGANLGELTRIDGIHVPDGFCLTTEAFKRIIAETPSVNELLDQLSQLKVENRSKINELSGEIRRVIEGITIPEDIQSAIIQQLSRLGENNAYAVRSSATAEDLPTASFAGQQDTYLNIIGTEAILTHISKCWASLFTERAVIYRLQTAASADQFDHRKVYLSVVVQKMVFPDAAGIMFTADPVTSNRNVVSIDASFGLGEALVSGLVNVDNFKVVNGRIVARKISAKKLGIYAVNEGGTNQQEIEPDRQNRPALADARILQLEHIGRKIETHFGSPQDIEWCLVDDARLPDGQGFYIVQSRPITTLYPIPARQAGGPVANDQSNAEAGLHIYISVGHQQMMTDAMKPLGLSFWLLTTPAHMRIAGGRLFADVTQMLASPGSRHTIIATLGKFDPLVKDALTTILERGDFIKSLPDEKKESGSDTSNKPVPLPNYQALNDYDPAIVSDLVRRSQTSIDALKQNIQSKSGSALFDFILDDIQQLKKSISDPQNMGVIMTAMNAASWINEKIELWLGEKNVADTLSQSVSNNITSEMGLALLDVADVIRPYPDVIDYLQKAKEDNFLDELLQFDGGQETKDAFDAYLDKYGMRCTGEIDITRSRWSEKPATLIPIILSHIKNVEPGASKRKFEQGQQEAQKKEQELVARLAQLPDGAQKVQDTKRMNSLVRNLSGYREYPKYSIVSHYFVYKQALLKEAEQLVQAGILQSAEDSYYLTFDEFRELVRTHQLDYQLIGQRKEEFKRYEKLMPPRVITSDGEIFTGKYKLANLPAGAMAGLAVSSGVIEGRARVIVNLEDAAISMAVLEEGDILVTVFTDPSWTPVFVSIKGLITEVGGLMTHGAVIAREYGLPAVVGVENATKRIKDGQRIRVNGTEGYVEIL
ncbi:phosphoenolpyruvate synthase [Spirosoma radiotolerans]|uniref:Prodigiosin synthesizing transferase PigC n=1 Tax=Spirosoma radiotolerans TaxID=1379870 RepID=A0A0E3ZUP0_9BACT|nr:phosphoenolpyruvate synthase [Spirosoma radiotolerans]AKD55319.1 phosphoenolpyruvate synthase [Spirosoma radiotolerans]